MADISNPDKLIYPDDGLTKTDLVEHYERVAEVMLPHLIGRPLTVERFPNGINAPGFMQKNAAPYFPENIGRIEIPKKDGHTTYPILNDKEGLTYLANLGSITFHTWTTTIDDLTHPDRLIFDLDPPAGATSAARYATRAVGDLLADLGLDSAPMATGSKGFHVFTRADATVSIFDVDRLSQGVAALLAASDPDRLTTEFRVENRRGRVFVDWLRNRYRSTSVVPWSLRPRPGAPMATPLSWDELDDTIPDSWTIGTVRERLDMADPWVRLEEANLSAAKERVETLVSEAGLTIAEFDRFRG